MMGILSDLMGGSSVTSLLPSKIRNDVSQLDRKLTGGLDQINQQITKGVRLVNGVSNIVGFLTGAGSLNGPRMGQVQLGQTWLDATSRNDPQINLHWDVVLYVSGLRFDLSPHIEEIQLPSVTLQSVEVFREGRMVPHAEAENTADIQLRVYEDVEQTAMKFFRTWKSKIRSANGTFGVLQDYAGMIDLITRDNTGQYKARYTCYNVWPTSIGSYTMTSGSGGLQTLDVTLTTTGMVLQPYGDL